MNVTEFLQWFFTPEPLFVGQRGFEAFGTAHLLTLAFCLVLIVLVVRGYARLPRGGDADAVRQRRRYLQTLSLVPVALLASRDVVIVVRGLMVPIFWPLHVCNLAEFTCVAFAFTPASRKRLRRLLGSVVFCWGLSGGAGALLFPGWSYCPIWTYASLGGFAEHSLMFAFAICMLFLHDFVPRLRDIWYPTVVSVAVGLFFLLVFNPAFDTNFFFVSRPLDMGTPFVQVYRAFGDPLWLAAYLAIAMGVWLLSYGIYRLIARM